MRRHFITSATVNSAMALSMAKEVWGNEKAPQEVEEMVKIIDQAARGLIKVCERIAFEATSTHN
jgi:hypothetical protein